MALGLLALMAGQLAATHDQTAQPVNDRPNRYRRVQPWGSCRRIWGLVNGVIGRLGDW